VLAEFSTAFDNGWYAGHAALFISRQCTALAEQVAVTVAAFVVKYKEISAKNT
jgi:hypothetical protein